jgi:hypothetical protein
VRSHTDTLTNVVVLSAVDVGRHFRDIAARDLPIATLPTFLHEATHHWCFDSPVGIALHLLLMRARRAALLNVANNARQDHGWDILDHVVRYEMIRDFTRPISEGLALFAEHDAIPGESKTISTPMARAAALYGRGYGVLSGTQYDGMPEVLAAARVSRRHARQKAALMLEPFTCVNGGYLPGYLLIKSMWRYARSRSPLFRDSDFFLQYIRGHLFEDWELVALLLDSNTKDIGALGVLHQHISYRLRHFLETAVDSDHPARFELLSSENTYESLVVSTDLVDLQFRVLPLQNGPLAQVGRERLGNALKAHFAGWTHVPLQDAMLNRDRDELLLRAVINLGRATLDAQPVEHGVRLSFDGLALAEVPPSCFRQDASSIGGPIEAEIISFAEPGSLCLTIAKDGRHVGTVSLSSRGVPETSIEWLIGRDDRSHHAVASYELIDQALTTADLREELAIIRREISGQLDDWFLPLALMNVETERLADVRREMRESGMLAVFDGDLNLLVDAAVASLCIPSPYTFGSVKSFHQWSELDPQTVLLRINRLVVDKLGFAPFKFNAEGIFEKAFFV